VVFAGGGEPSPSDLVVVMPLIRKRDQNIQIK
jgi:hypothetical protein